jgi:hypothetical protein
MCPRQVDGSDYGASIGNEIPDLNKGDISGGNLPVWVGQSSDKQSEAAPIVIRNDDGNNNRQRLYKSELNNNQYF